MALAHCILGKFLEVACHCFPPLIRRSHFSPPGASTSSHDARDPIGGSRNCGRECCPVILPKWRLPRHLGDLLHAANLRHGTDGFTSPPKEGVLRIFSSLKIRRLRPGIVDYTSQQDFGTRKVYCVSNVTFHAESKYAIKSFSSPTVFVQWPF